MMMMGWIDAPGAARICVEEPPSGLLGARRLEEGGCCSLRGVKMLARGARHGKAIGSGLLRSDFWSDPPKMETIVTRGRVAVVVEDVEMILPGDVDDLAWKSMLSFGVVRKHAFRLCARGTKT